MSVADQMRASGGGARSVSGPTDELDARQATGIQAAQDRDPELNGRSGSCTSSLRCAVKHNGEM